MMAALQSNRSSNWKLTSPIPADPTYDKYVVSQKPAQLKNQLKSPIPIDPVFNKSEGIRNNTPKPRIKSEALAIARSHQGKDLAYLFNPAFQIIPIGVKPSIKSNRDYNKENFRKIKQIQKANKEKQVESSRQTPVKVVYKSDKYEHIQSKVGQHILTPNAPRKSTNMKRSQSMSDIHRVEGKDKALSKAYEQATYSSRTKKQENKRPSSAQVASSKRFNNSVNETPDKRPTSAFSYKPKHSNSSPSKSHIARNVQLAKSSNLKRSPSLSALDDLKKKQRDQFNKYKRGETPKYLKSHQNEWKKDEEERIANLPDPTVPTGHSLMPESERIKTLNILKKSHKEMMDELQALPVSRDTLRMRTRKDVIEKKLREVDTALKIFSRPRVFVKEDD